MAPVDIAGTFREMQSVAWLSSPEVATVSLFAFFILSVVFLALCAQCRRKPTNAYDVSGATAEGVVNGAAVKDPTDPATVNYIEWRAHANMPPNTLERANAGVSS